MRVVLWSACFLLACGGSSGVEPEPDAGDRGAPVDAAPGEDGASTTQDSGADAGIDLQTDPNNCGFVGHVCEKGCSKGLCTPVQLRLTSGDFWAVDGTSLYWTSGTKLYAGSVSTASSDKMIATLASPPLGNWTTFATTASYVYLQTSTGGVTVNKSTHAVSTFTFVSGGEAFGGLTANDKGVSWYDDSGFLWTVPMNGGTPKADYTWTVSGVVADPSGIYFYGGPQSGDTTGVWMLAGTAQTQLADGVAQTYEVFAGTKNVYGLTSSGSATCTASSTIWSVPKAGSLGGAGSGTNLYSSTTIGLVYADDTSIVWAPCSGTGAIVSLAPTKGSKPHAVLASSDTSWRVDGVYLYFMQPDGTSLTTAELARVTR